MKHHGIAKLNVNDLEEPIKPKIEPLKLNNIFSLSRTKCRLSRFPELNLAILSSAHEEVRKCIGSSN